MSYLGGLPERERTARSELVPAELCLELPPVIGCAAVEVTDLDAVLEALADRRGEHPDFARFAKKRLAEYLAGRYAAELALAAIGVSARVGRLASGLPDWPASAVGSISHGAGIACALAAKRERFRGLGIDVERVLDDAEAHDLAPSIAAPDELLLLRSALPHTRAGQRLSVAFAAKEALFKAIFPLTHEFLEFSEVKVVSVGMASRYQGALTLRLERTVGSDFISGMTLSARFFLGPERVESAVLLGGAVSS